MSEITLPNLLLCEGPSDISFFRNLIAIRNLPIFSIRDTSPKRGSAGGNSKFGDKLKALRTDRGWPRVRHLLVVADNDEDPADSFNYVRNQLAAVLGVANVPKGPLVRQAVTNSLSLQIVMVPWTDEQGNLETMCITPARNAQKAVGTHVDNFAAVTKADSWQSLSRRNEMWLRSNLAARCKTDPFVPLGIVFQDHKDLIPLKDKSFDRLANVLESYR